MLIGIDLDNTIVCYDGVFERLASELELPGHVPSAGKQAIRDYLRQQNREDEWTLMQGKAYGSRMSEAQPFESALEFMACARDRGHELCIVSHRTKQPFLGDPAAQLQALLPDDIAFDMAVNIFTYAPGGTLPFVECHIMEHGMLILEGAGVYKLGDDWHPVERGDALWLAPYCPQWFVAMGKTPARYIYYKDVNRAPRLG